MIKVITVIQDIIRKKKNPKISVILIEIEQLMWLEEEEVLKEEGKTAEIRIIGEEVEEAEGEEEVLGINLIILRIC